MLTCTSQRRNHYCEYARNCGAINVGHQFQSSFRYCCCCCKTILTRNYLLTQEVYLIDSTNKYLMSVELPEIFGKYTGEQNFILFGVKKHKSLFKAILKLYCSSSLFLNYSPPDYCTKGVSQLTHWILPINSHFPQPLETPLWILQ